MSMQQSVGCSGTDPWSSSGLANRICVRATDSSPASGSKSEWAFADAFAQLAPVVGAFFGLEFLRQRFFGAGPSDRGHGFDLELVRNPQRGPGAVVIEPLHSMDNQALAKTLKRE